MLYDPKWEVQKPDVFSVAGLIAWLETKPANGNYSWLNCDGGCLIGLYGAAMKMGDAWHQFHSKLYCSGELDIARTKPWTFGAALRRARAYPRSPEGSE